MAYQQASIAVENTQAFEQLKGTIEACLTQKVTAFFGAVDSAGFRVRHFESILEKGLFDKATGQKKGTAGELYGQLSMSDRGLVREKYLTELEQVSPELRRKYQKLYRYS